MQNQFNARHRSFSLKVIRNLLSIMALASVAIASAQIQPTPAQAIRPQTFDSKSPTDWFRRADDLTNIRLPGSVPFHMKVTFHAFPGIDFSKPGKSTMLTGDGIYEETWLSPEKWRREVTLGTYHAVEVRADGVRKFQATSDYEPSRVLMLLRALLIPIPRMLVEPELQEIHLHLQLSHRTAGTLSYVRIAFTQDLSGSGLPLDSGSWEFLPTALLVRATDITGLVTTWQDDRPFDSKIVPRHLAVEALGNQLVSADVAIDALHDSDTAVAQLPGEAADPGMTLRPFHGFWDHQEVKTWPDIPAIHSEMPVPPSDADYPADAVVSAIAVIDRQGIPHEAEWTNLQGEKFVGVPTPDKVDIYNIMARSLAESWYKDRFHPALIDGKPCEVTGQMRIVGLALQTWGMGSGRP
jgi:hypothetical protein